ncbi:hypothetical protein RM533_05545 [Croceicoccus sp. F390]|uniref:Uncharacterized protein n=1 Tax=Croceicoccus esteveae TaxID=3075597 RepID=A0ABU2ZJS2_9SPHN|nr:hypothetical protein [Croceicoccus sp. F390]MDT0575642.1 hypothetical protein [Croceicoccus sp. F390]
MTPRFIKGSQAGALFGLAAGIAALGACSTPPPQPAPPPPPVVQEAFPARPIAPYNAHEGLRIPAVDANGVRQTVNSGLTPSQMIWNVRSAYNVAALNCTGPVHAALAENYGMFLKGHDKELTAANRTLNEQFRSEFGAKSNAVRDAYMTQVYNYFALPAVLPDFCQAALQMSEQLALVPQGELETTAAQVLPDLERVFVAFFDRYDSYRAQAAAWDANYLATYGEPYPYAPRMIIDTTLPVTESMEQAGFDAAVGAGAPIAGTQDEALPPSS